MSVRAIARRFHHSRRVVRRAIRFLVLKELADFDSSCLA